MYQHITNMLQHMRHLSTNETYVEQLNTTIFVQLYEENGQKRTKTTKTTFHLTKTMHIHILKIRFFLNSSIFFKNNK